MKKIAINFSNKTFYTLVTLFVLIFGSLVVYAYDSPYNNPSVMGHSINELAPPVDCTIGQVLAWGGVSWMCIDAGNVGGCPSGYELFSNQLGEICIPIDDWELSSSASEKIDLIGDVSVSAESRIYNGVRQVRITECKGQMGSCTTDWSNDFAFCRYYANDVYQPGCLAITTSRYLVKAVHGNLYGDVPIGSFVETVFGPGLQLAIPIPEGVGIDVAKGEHKGGCVLKDQNYYSAECISETWPGKCSSDSKSCSGEEGYRPVYRWDLFQRAGYDGFVGPGRIYHYDCIKN
jgi:hypothetical protein